MNNNTRFLFPLGWALLMLVCAWVTFTQTPVVTDLTLFLPQTNTSTQQLLVEQLRSGPATRLIFIALEGDSSVAQATVSKRLAQQLRQLQVPDLTTFQKLSNLRRVPDLTTFQKLSNLRLFTQVLNGEQMLDHTTQQQLFAYRYLLNPHLTPEYFNAEHLRQALQQRLRELSSPLSTVTKQFLPSDPTGEWLSLLSLWQGPHHLNLRHGVWFSTSGKRALLLLETPASGFDLDAQAPLVAAIQQTFATCKGETQVKLLLSGTALFALATRDTVRFEVQLLSLVASFLVIGLLLWVFRSVWLLILSILPLLSAIFVGVTSVSLLFGEIHGITLAFGTTLLGITDDYPIHLLSHLSNQETARHSVQRIQKTLLLSILTTGIGYLAMMTTEFNGLLQLGLFGMVGLAAAAVCTLWVLPPLLACHRTSYRETSLPRWLLSLLQPPRWLAQWATLLVILAFVSLFIFPISVWQDDLAELTPVPAAARELDQTLRLELGAAEPNHIVVITASDVETALQRSETVATELTQLRQAGVITGFDLAANYLPSVRTQQQRQALLPDQTTLSTALETALNDLPFKPGLFTPFLAEITAAKEKTPLQFKELENTVLGLRISSLLFHTAQGWTALIPLIGVQDPQQLANWFAQHAEKQRYYLDLKAEVNQLVASFRHDALVRVAWGIIFMVLILWLGLRSLRAALTTLWPVLLALGLTITLLLWSGEKLTLFHLISLLLTLGLGIDYSLFFGRTDDLATRQRTLHAVLLCMLSTAAVFGTLGLSAIPVLKAIGQTVAIGTVASFGMALVIAQPTVNSTSRFGPDLVQI